MVLKRLRPDILLFVRMSHFPLSAHFVEYLRLVLNGLYYSTAYVTSRDPGLALTVAMVVTVVA